MRLSVTETGPGMDRETLHHIFEPSFTTRGLENGTGLGLATVYGIIKQHNGYIWTNSELRHGTTFKIYLPVADAEVIGDKTKEHTTTELNGSEVILLVEDDEHVRSLACTVLETEQVF